MKFEIKLNGKTMMQANDESCFCDAKTIGHTTADERELLD